MATKKTKRRTPTTRSRGSGGGGGADRQQKAQPARPAPRPASRQRPTRRGATPPDLGTYVAPGVVALVGLVFLVAAGYESIDYDVIIKGDGTAADFEDIHQTVMKTSPNYFNISRPIRMNGTLRVS